MAACLLAAVAASVYLVEVLEILKLRQTRLRQLGHPPPPGRQPRARAARGQRRGRAGARDRLLPEPSIPETGEFQAIEQGAGVPLPRHSTTSHWRVARGGGTPAPETGSSNPHELAS